MITNNSFENESVNNGAKRPRLALIAGPTASGKSDLAVKLALRAIARGQEAVIVNADSAQVYADLRVLSARPSEEDMQGVPHVLYGAWDGDAGMFGSRLGEGCQTTKSPRPMRAGLCPSLWAGPASISGHCLMALLRCRRSIPRSGPKSARCRLEAAYAALQSADPARAALLAPADAQRITRALEVVRSTGHSLGHWQTRLSGGIANSVDLAPLILLPERQWLYKRCGLRFDLMWNGGAIAEVRRHRPAGPALPPRAGWHRGRCQIRCGRWTGGPACRSPRPGVSGGAPAAGRPAGTA